MLLSLPSQLLSLLFGQAFYLGKLCLLFLEELRPPALAVLHLLLSPLFGLEVAVESLFFLLHLTEELLGGLDVRQTGHRVRGQG